MNKLPLGKVPIKVLRRILNIASSQDESVIVGPGVGIDSAVLGVQDSIILVASDPITGASKDIGWLSVHVNANDILASGGEPKWYSVILLFPESTEEEEIIDVMDGIKEGLGEIGASIVAGHTELTNKVSDTIVAGTMIGEPIVRGRYIANNGAKPGDKILMTKGAGIEGTWILAQEFKEELGASPDSLSKIIELKKEISVYRDVHAIIDGIGIDNVHAMHDATEGGVLGAIYEIAEASNIGFVIDRDKVLLREETKFVCRRLNLDPLELISSGTLIAAISPEFEEAVLQSLEKRGIPASIIGEFVNNTKMRVVKKGDKIIRTVDEPPIDALWKLYGGKA